MRPDEIVISRKNVETIVTIINHAREFVYAFGERPAIFKWIFKKIMGRYAQDEFQKMADALKKY